MEENFNAEAYDILNFDEGTQELFANLLALPENEFAVLAPSILSNAQAAFNQSGQQIALAQAMNATGTKVEDFKVLIDEVINSLEEVEISDQKKDFVKQYFAIMYNSIIQTEGIAKRVIEVPLELCHHNSKLPVYAHVTDSGADVYAIEDITINPGETKLIPTGIKAAIPLGYELQVRPKSGRSLKSKLRVANTPGTIDSGYRDEIGIIIDNIDPFIKDATINEDGTISNILYGSSYTISKGEKIAQLVLMEVPKANFYEVSEISPEGDRGGGFGSTSLYDEQDSRYGTDID